MENEPFKTCKYLIRSLGSVGAPFQLYLEEPFKRGPRMTLLRVSHEVTDLLRIREEIVMGANRMADMLGFMAHVTRTPPEGADSEAYSRGEDGKFVNAHTNPIEDIEMKIWRKKRWNSDLATLEDVPLDSSMEDSLPGSTAPRSRGKKSGGHGPEMTTTPMLLSETPDTP